MAKPLFVLALIVTLAALPASGRAGAVSHREVVAKTFTKRGVRWFNEGRYDKARDAFQAAHAALPTPDLVFRIAQCQRQLSVNNEAAKGYRLYLELEPDGENADEARAHLAVLAPKASVPATPAPTVEHKDEDEQIAQARARALQLEREGVEPSPLSPRESASESPPVYKRWWLWTTIGVVAAVGLGVGLGVGLTRGKDEGFSPTLPSFGSTATAPAMMQLRF